MKTLKTIYEYFKDFSKEQVDEMLTKLDDDDKRFYSAVVSGNATKEQRIYFYNILLKRMKNLLINPNFKLRKKRTKLFLQSDVDIPTEEIPVKGEENVINSQIKTPIEETIETAEKNEPLDAPKKITLPIVTTELNLTIDEGKNEGKDEGKDEPLLTYSNNLLKNPLFYMIFSSLPLKSAIVIALRYGFADNVWYPTEKIAKLLDIEEDEVREIARTTIKAYKEKLDSYLTSLMYIDEEENFQR